MQIVNALGEASQEVWGHVKNYSIIYKNSYVFVHLVLKKVSQDPINEGETKAEAQQCIYKAGFLKKKKKINEQA